MGRSPPIYHKAGPVEEAAATPDSEAAEDAATSTTNRAAVAE
jgi:hypothetical protein